MPTHGKAQGHYCRDVHDNRLLIEEGCFSCARSAIVVESHKDCIRKMHRRSILSQYSKAKSGCKVKGSLKVTTLLPRFRLCVASCKVSLSIVEANTLASKFRIDNVDLDTTERSVSILVCR